jgi:hypothetical protein
LMAASGSRCPRVLVLLQGWVAYIKKQRSCPCVAVNSHSRESIKEIGQAMASSAVSGGFAIV